MAGFNVNTFRDNALGEVVQAANNKQRQVQSMWLNNLEKLVWGVTSVGRRFMTFRTWNYAASVVGMFLYDGKLVGVETEGKNYETTRVAKPAGRRVGTYKVVKQNPVYGYNLTRGGDTPWRYAMRKNMSLKTGRDWANFAAENYIESSRHKKGYLIAIIVGMPYAMFNTGRMKERTTRMLEVLIKSRLGSFGTNLSKIKVEVTTTTY